MLLDVLLLGNDGRWLEIELKGADTVTQDFQKVLAARSGGVCRSLGAFVEAVERWEGEPPMKTMNTDKGGERDAQGVEV